MRVVQINCVNINGSTGRIVSQISNYLEKHGEESHVAHGIPSSGQDCDYTINNKIDAHLHSFISRKLCMQGKGSVLATRRLTKYLNKIKPDIIHLHNLHGHYLNYQVLFQYLAKCDVPVVWTLHDCWSMTGKCAHFTKVGCYKWKSEKGCYSCPQLSTYPDSTYDRTAKNFSEKKKAFTSVSNLTIVTVSEWLKSICEQSFLKEKKIVCIQNGVDTDIFTPSDKSTSDICRRYGIPNKKIILGVASIWNAEKGEASFLKLADMLPDDYVIVLVGKGSDKVIEGKNNMIAVQRTNSQKELAMLYSISTVFLCMSVEESAPLVVSEAMACGTPVIGYNSTAVPELIHKGLGYIAPAGDINVVKKFIFEIAEKKGKEYYSNECISHARAEHSVEHMTNEYYELYRTLCSD